MKVVWLCHFANKEIGDYFNTHNVMETAPWISNLITLFRSETEIELHIVAPNIFTNKDIMFRSAGTTFHFYKFRNSLFTRKVHIVKSIIFPHDFSYIKHKVQKIIQDINPDLIHLHGAENPYYSAAILPLIGKFPVTTTIQGFIRNSTCTNRIIAARIKIEEEIIKKCEHFGTRTIEMRELVKTINPKAQTHFHNYPLNVPHIIKENHGKDESIDCMFFARVSKDKGIEDLLETIAIIKQTIPNVTLHVIGTAPRSYFDFLNERCKFLDIVGNVSFLGFLSSQSQIYEHAMRAKLCVLPTHHDIIPGTILESMLMKLPVVSYAVGGIPELNEKTKIIKLVQKGDIKGLSNAIIDLLNDVEERRSLSEKAYNHCLAHYKDSSVVENIKSMYIRILRNTSSLI